LEDAGSTEATNVVEYVKSRVTRFNKDELEGVEFPLPNDSADELRVLKGLKAGIVASWLDPLTVDPDGPRGFPDRPAQPPFGGTGGPDRLSNG
jgi:hypothetical protein